MCLCVKVGRFGEVAIRNLNPKTYKEALALAQNKELNLNCGKPRQAVSSSATPATPTDAKKIDNSKAGKRKKPK